MRVICEGRWYKSDPKRQFSRVQMFEHLCLHLAAELWHARQYLNVEFGIS